MLFGSHVMPWTKHVRACRDLVHRTIETANKIGDLTFAAYSRNNLNTNLLAAGDPLAEVQRVAEEGLEFARTARFGLVIDIITAQLGLIRTLGGKTPKFGSFDDGQLDEIHFEHHLENDPAALPECFYWIRKLQARFLAEDYGSAIDASLKAQRLLWTAPSNLEMVEYHFYGALSHAASWNSASSDEKQQHFEALTAHHRQIEVWAQNCPENFENRAALLGAEIARIEGRMIDAEHLYENAIRSAHENGFVHNEAVAYEVAARFYLARGFKKIANAYLMEARYCYLRWGAAGKVRQLDELYPTLQGANEVPATSTIGAPVEHLDLATVMKVSQAVTGEMVLERLIDTLMRAAIEHAGAERGLLILPQGAELRIQAEAITPGSSVNVNLTDRPISSAELPEQIVQYTARTLDSIILEDAWARGSFPNDEYIGRTHARSILCVPLIKQRRLIAVLYLENNLAANVFTPRRTAVLNVLASAAAISLENSRLYHDLQEREAKIRRLIDANVVGIFVWDFEGRILEANDAFLLIVGYDRDDVVGGHLRWTDLTPPEWLERDTQQWMPKLKMTGSLQPFEKEYFRRDGSRVPVLNGLATLDETGNQGLAFVLDLTQRKRTEEERARLHQLEADLAHINRVNTMGELTASLAHEIKQPIGAVVTNAEACVRLLDRDEPDLPEAREAAFEMVRDARRAAEVIDHVRSLYRKGSSQLDMVDVNQVIGDMVVMLRSEANRHSVTIHTDLAEGLPTVMADRVQLQQALMNLMLNGIEAMNDTSGELSVRSKRTEDGQLLVSVSDCGIGLPVKQVERIFDAFFTTKPHGTGMGLSISRTIIESYGGHLWATPNAERGATFHFTLPTEVKASSPSAA
jgi:PAS domain S-box-containing protein